MSEITIGEFIFRRLQQIGVQTIFGVPGDYELRLLDFVEPAGSKWIGTPNELVGAYAADGYARQKGAGAVVTTFGPGELSALCGLGGAYCEMVPVLHIVGYPSFAAQASGKILHHTLGDKSYDHYVRMSSELSCATAVLKDLATAASEIDRVLNAMLYHSQPGYIGITEDVVVTKIPTSMLETTKLSTTLAPGPQDEAAVNAIVARLEEAENPIIIVDGGASRHEWAPHIDSLIAALEVPYFTTILGKGIVNEAHPLYGGCYAGASSLPQTSAAVEKADCVLWLGNLPSDFNTGRFSQHVKSTVIIDLQRFSVMVGGQKYDARINHVLPRLSGAAKSSQLFSTRSKPQPEPLLMPEVPLPIPITQEYIWNRFATFLKPGDLVVTETGTSQLGITATKYPSGVESWTQAVWGSIGYATGAAVGASIAAKEIGKHKRMILFTGEGSLQLTIQAFSILNRHGIVPVVFVLNNNGYTVERYFNGWTAAYNDVPMWDYEALFKAFSPGEKDIKTFKMQTAAELDSLLSDEAFNTATYPQCVDMVMDAFDAPASLKAVFK